jgi:peptide/nickel transport system substrate-binding protein
MPDSALHANLRPTPVAAENSGRPSCDGPNSRLALVCGLLVLLFSTGCGREPALPDHIQAVQKTAAADSLRIGLYGYPFSLHPLEHAVEPAPFVMTFIHGAPLRRLPGGEYAGDLFESFATMLNEEGDLVIDALWRAGATWHDGRPCTASDLEFTLRRLAAAKGETPFGAVAALVKQVSVLDRGRRVHLVFTGSSRQYLDLLAVGLVPAHLIGEQPLLEAKLPAVPPSGLPEAPPAPPASGTIAYSSQPVGAGPFALQERAKGNALLLRRSADAIPGEGKPSADPTVPGLSTVLVRGYGRLDNLISDFRGDRLDLMQIPSEIADKLAELRMPAVRFFRLPNPSCLVWSWNLRRPPFDRPVLRRALDAMIDRARLRAAIPYAGSPLWTAPLTASATVPPTNPASWEQITRWLEEAEVVDRDGDGKREFDGRPLEIEILIHAENLARKPLADLLAEMVKPFGLTAKVVAVPWSEFIDTRLRRGEFDSYLGLWLTPSYGNWVNLLHSKAVPVPEQGASGMPGSPLNFGRWASPRADELLMALDRLPAPDDPRAVRQELGEVLAEERPVAFLFRPEDVTVAKAGLQGMIATATLWEQDIRAWRKGSEPGATTTAAAPAP